MFDPDDHSSPCSAEDAMTNDDVTVEDGATPNDEANLYDGDNLNDGATPNEEANLYDGDNLNDGATPNEEANLYDGDNLNDGDTPNDEANLHDGDNLNDGTTPNDAAALDDGATHDDTTSLDHSNFLNDAPAPNDEETLQDSANPNDGTTLNDGDMLNDDAEPHDAAILDDGATPNDVALDLVAALNDGATLNDIVAPNDITASFEVAVDGDTLDDVATSIDGATTNDDATPNNAALSTAPSPPETEDWRFPSISDDSLLLVTRSAADSILAASRIDLGGTGSTLAASGVHIGGSKGILPAGGSDIGGADSTLAASGASVGDAAPSGDVSGGVVSNDDSCYYPMSSPVENSEPSGVEATVDSPRQSIDEGLLNDLIGEMLQSCQVVNKHDARAEGKRIVQTINVEVPVQRDVLTRMRETDAMRDTVSRLHNGIHGHFHASVPNLVFRRIPSREIVLENGGLLHKIGSLLHLTGSPELPTCPLCETQAADREVIKTLFCGHQFHEHCLRSCFENQAQCPTCGRCAVCLNDEFRVNFTWIEYDE